MAADVGTLQRFPKVVGNDSVARELCYTCREFDAEEALRIGFLSRVVKGGRDGVLGECPRRSRLFRRAADPRLSAAAIVSAAMMATKAPIALRSTKRLLLHARDHSVDEGLKYTAVWNSAMLQSEDIPVAVSLPAWASCRSETTADGCLRKW